MAGASLSPAVLTAIESSFVTKLSAAFTSVSHYALELFYIIAVIEIAFLGITWAIKQDAAIGSFLIKVIKLGIIFFIISAYPYVLQTLIDGFTKIAFSTSSDATGLYIFNPAHLWQFGFDSGISMLKLAASYGTANFGMSMLYLILGFGSLLLFALIGAEIILVVVAFYVVSLVALLMIPLGSFYLAHNLFTRAIQAVMKIGAMVFALILVVGIGVTIWSQFNLSNITEQTSLMQPLGLFFATLVIWILAVKLPKLAASAIGEFGGEVFNRAPQVVVSTPASNSSPQILTAPAQVAAGSSLTANASVLGASPAATQAASSLTASPASNVASSVNVNASGMASSVKVVGSGDKNKKVSQASDINRGVSNETMKKLKDEFG